MHHRRCRLGVSLASLGLASILAGHSAVAQPSPAVPPAPDPSAASYPPFMPNPAVAGSMVAGNPFAMGGIYVELNSSSRPVRIDRVIGPGLTAPVCVSPCRQVLPRNSVYVIEGDGVRTTPQFVLPADRDRVVLDVEPGSTGAAVGGGVLMGAGLLIGYAGLLATAAGGIEGSLDDGSTNRSSSDRLKHVGEIMLAGGLVAAVVGLYLIIDSKTVVKSSTGAVFSERPARGRVALTPRGLVF